MLKGGKGSTGITYQIPYTAACLSQIVRAKNAMNVPHWLKKTWEGILRPAVWKCQSHLVVLISALSRRIKGGPVGDFKATVSGFSQVQFPSSTLPPFRSEQHATTGTSGVAVCVSARFILVGTTPRGVRNEVYTFGKV